MDSGASRASDANHGILIRPHLERRRSFWIGQQKGTVTVRRDCARRRSCRFVPDDASGRKSLAPALQRRQPVTEPRQSRLDPKVVPMFFADGVVAAAGKSNSSCNWLIGVNSGGHIPSAEVTFGNRFHSAFRTDNASRSAIARGPDCRHRRLTSGRTALRSLSARLEAAPSGDGVFTRANPLLL